jgi:hypothetical protein
MTGRKNSEDQQPPQEDEIQRAAWHHWAIIAGVIVLLIAARFVLPHIPLLKGWEQKFSGAAIEFGKQDIPPDALQVGTYEGPHIVFEKPAETPADMIQLNGPVLVAAWKCKPLGDTGSCLRYIWRGEPLTLLVTTHTKRFNKTNGPFSRTGWGGYFIVQKNLAAALVGPFEPADLLSVWPYAVRFANSKH